MNISAIIKSALSDLDLPVSWIEHRGEETEYIVFDFEEIPSLYGDNSDVAISAMVYVYYFTTCEPFSKISEIRNALRASDFTILETMTTAASDANQKNSQTELIYRTLIRARFDGCSEIWG